MQSILYLGRTDSLCSPSCLCALKEASTGMQLSQETLSTPNCVLRGTCCVTWLKKAPGTTEGRTGNAPHAVSYTADTRPGAILTDTRPQCTCTQGTPAGVLSCLSGDHPSELQSPDAVVRTREDRKEGADWLLRSTSL